MSGARKVPTAVEMAFFKRFLIGFSNLFEGEMVALNNAQARRRVQFPLHSCAVHGMISR